MDNGLWWRGDSQGLIGLHYAIHIPEIPLNVVATIPIDVPIKASFTTTVYHGITIEDIPFGTTVTLGPIPVLQGTVNSLTIPPISATGPTPAIQIGRSDGSTAIVIPAFASLGPADWTIIDIGGAPGIRKLDNQPVVGVLQCRHRHRIGLRQLRRQQLGFAERLLGELGLQERRRPGLGHGEPGQHRVGIPEHEHPGPRDAG
ncbi:hypothetical protein I546_6802 [Mycobacterium kansasii 732]|nr:hypothetical protein I546_6802 [Mycobacterium kansasii 732]